jgi:hypothetical protein
MPGFSDYAAETYLNNAYGVNVSASRFAALFTGAPTSDAGTGGTECSGSGYARQQFAGSLAAGASWTTSSTTITLGSTAPAWLTALGTVANPGYGVNVYDTTTGQQIGVVQSISGAIVTLQAAAAHASSGSADNLQFSAFGPAAASSGTEPGVTPANITSTAQINWPAATGGGAGFGTVVFQGVYDAVTSGNYFGGDYLGNYSWLAASISAASPGVFTTHAHGYSVGDTVVATAKYGGAVPSFSQSNLTGLLAIAHAATDTFDVTNAATAVNTSSSGDLMVRKVGSQQVPSGVQFYIPAGSAVASLA